MQQLIQQLAVKKGVTNEHEIGILFTIKESVQENFPAFGYYSPDEVFATDTSQEQNIVAEESGKKDYITEGYQLYTLFKRKAV